MSKKHIITLTEEERTMLSRRLSSGRDAARTLTRARILLKADQSAGGPGWSDSAIARALDISIPTIERVRRRFVEEGLEASLKARPRRREYRHKLDGRGEAHLVALACSEPPEGRSRWTLRLLADRLVELDVVEDVSYETVRRTLKKTS